MARVIMHPDVVPFLFQLKNNYTQIDLFELAKLTDSVYSLRIFLLMMQWKSSGKVYKQLDELRREFRLLDKYENTKDLRRRVIDMAVNEINEKTIYKVSYELKKTGRKYTHLELKFTEKGQPKNVTPARDPDTINMFTNYTDKQLARAVHSKKFMADYNGLIAAQNPANQSSGAWISHMVEWVKKDPERFTKRPVQEYLDDEQAPRF